MEFLNEPWIVKLSLKMAPPSLADNTADVDRLVRQVRRRLHGETVHVPFGQVKGLPRVLRGSDFTVDAVLARLNTGWHLIEVRESRPRQDIYGIALDLGTSTIVVRLVNLATHGIEDEISFENPQTKIGPDILTRIHYAAQEEGLETLQSLLIDRLNKEIRRLTQKHDIDGGSIVGISLAGNTTMTHLFLGLDPYRICREPYIPVVNRFDFIRSSELGLEINPRAPILVFPNIGSYFGGDVIAGILASGMSRQPKVSFLVDIGTNAEVVLGNNEWLLACAGAAGPALEGGVASIGMTASPGAIDKVSINLSNSEFELSTIGDQSPVGICGSGLIDLVSQLYLAGMLDMRGKFVPEQCGRRLTEIEGIRHLVVVPGEESGTGQPLTLSQADVDALIRSKAAMYTILTTIANTVGLSVGDVEEFYIAGTFGAYIDPASAVTLGMMPDLPLDTFVPLGNSSLEGTTLALLSREARDEIFQIRDQITYIELNVNQEFMNLFNAAKFIPHTDHSLFPTVKAKAS